MSFPPIDEADQLEREVMRFEVAGLEALAPRLAQQDRAEAVECEPLEEHYGYGQLAA